MQINIWPSWCHCHSLSLASVKFRLVLPFWYRLTWVVPDKGPLNGCVCVCVVVALLCPIHTARQTPQEGPVCVGVNWKHAAVICPQRVHILRGVQRRCVWAVWRLGLHCSCLPGLRHGGDGRRGTIFCRWQSWVFENPILTAEADTTETGLLCRVWPGGVNWVQCY